MKKKGEFITLTKKERLAIAELLHHVRIDMSFMEGGTFGDGENLYDRQFELAREGYDAIKKILDLITE